MNTSCEMPLRFGRFCMSEERGFLPIRDPLRRLNRAFDDWEMLAAELPHLLSARAFGKRLEQLPQLDPIYLYPNEGERAHMLLSFFMHAYLWEEWRENKVRSVIPANFAVPYAAVSRMVGRPPILSYVSYALQNWRRINPAGPIALDNIALLQYFLGGLDEAWFTLVHVEIEAHAGAAMSTLVRAQEAAMFDKQKECEEWLDRLVKALERMNAAFARMPERCDPYIYYNRVRPWIHGTKNHPLLPHGVIYEGVEEFGGKPQKFRGETGAQSSIAPALDAGLGVVHEPSVLSEHLLEMRQYMPPGHRSFIAAVESRPAIRAIASKHAALHEVFNACIDGIWRFRKTHYEYAALYIYGQEKKKGHGANPTGVGTGGTSFMESLKKHLDETLAAKI